MSSFADAEGGDYTLVDGAALFDAVPDFAPIPLSEIGCVD